jgi:hypothetical protein
MASDSVGGDLTAEGYWGQLRAWGFSNPARVTPTHYTMKPPGGDVANVPDPACLSPEARAAALELLKRIYVSFSS